MITSTKRNRSLVVLALFAPIFGTPRLLAEAEIVEEGIISSPFRIQGDHRFAWSVAIDGDTLAVGDDFDQSGARGVNGTPHNDDARDSGAAFVFVRDGAEWRQQAYLKASNSEASDRFGTSVAVSGDTIVVGALMEDGGARSVNGDQDDNSLDSAGAAYVFVRDGTEWRQQAYLKASNADPGDWFGRSVAISGDTIVVGASREGNGSGAAYVFVRSGDTWTQQAHLKASNADAGDWYGQALAIEGDTIVVGAGGEHSRSMRVNGDQGDNGSPSARGAAYVYVRDGATWTQQAYLKASAVVEQFGDAVDIEGDTIVVGASGVFGDASSSTSGAYIFVRDGDSWTQQAHLNASNVEEGDAMGFSVAISGNFVVAGAPAEDSSATGINGDENDNSTEGSGAVYAFQRTGTSWNQIAYIKASNSRSFGNFGSRVAASGDSFVIANFSWEEVTIFTGFEDGDPGPLSLLERALGSGRLDVAATEASFSVTYLRRRDRVEAGLSYNLETSTDLRDWSPAGGLESLTIVDATWERVTVLVDLQDGSPEIFARVRVSTTE